MNRYRVDIYLIGWRWWRWWQWQWQWEKDSYPLLMATPAQNLPNSASTCFPILQNVADFESLKRGGCWFLQALVSPSCKKIAQFECLKREGCWILLILIQTMMIVNVWKDAFRNYVTLHLTKGPSASLVVDERVQLRKARGETRPEQSSPSSSLNDYLDRSSSPSTPWLSEAPGEKLFAELCCLPWSATAWEELTLTMMLIWSLCDIAQYAVQW